MAHARKVDTLRANHISKLSTREPPSELSEPPIYFSHFAATPPWPFQNQTSETSHGSGKAAYGKDLAPIDCQIR